MARRIMLRSDDSASWEASNPILEVGEAGYDSTTKKVKIGDGTHTWNELAFLTENVDGITVVSNAVCAQNALSAEAIDWNKAYNHKTISTTTAFTFLNNVDGKSVSFVLNGGGSDRSVSWPAGVKWGIGTSHLTVKANKYNVYSFIQVNGIIFGTVVADMS